MDARVRYTKNIIKNVMLEMLSEMEISKITVSEICSRAQINRATFYKYYDNPYDLLEHLEYDLLDVLENKINDANPKNFKDVFRVVLNDIKENISSYNILFFKNGDARFRERLFTLCYSSNIRTIKVLFPNLPEKYRVWLYYMIAEGCNGVLKQWLEDGMSEPVENVVIFLENIINSINFCSKDISNSLNK